MVCWISSKILVFISKFMEISPEMKDAYQYGIEITVSSIFNIILVLLCSMALGDIFAGITYLFVFIFLRSFTGGYHATTYFRCNITMVFTFLITCVSYKIIVHYELPLFICEAIALINLIPIVIFSPVPNKHKPLIDSQRKRYYKLSLLIASVLSLVGLILYTLEISVGAMIIITVTMVSVLIIVEIFMQRRGSKNVRIGVHKRMADGTYKNCSVPYGFIYKDGKIVLDTEKVGTVRQIFEWYANGIGAEEISARLNRNGVPAPFGKCWRTPRILEILANEKYVGDTLLQKSFMTDTLPFRQTANQGEKPQYYISGTHRPIIERGLFEEVQSLIKSRKPNNDFNSQPSVFRRKIKCVCGGTFRRKKNGYKIYWVCRNHDHKNIGDCDIRQIGEWIFQSAFIRLCNKLQAHYKAILAPMLRQLETLSEKENRATHSLRNFVKKLLK
ncbi:MAG: accessory gene regulator B family protein [Oscillospiraceae bacterium]|nr:accessory gene regulator B family protein [Oscillospiraceae bacterium]